MVKRNYNILDIPESNVIGGSSLEGLTASYAFKA